MLAIVETDGDYESTWVIGVKIYHGIDTEKEYNVLYKEWSKVSKEMDKLRKLRKLKPTAEVFKEIYTELGFPDMFQTFLSQKGISVETVEYVEE